MEFAGLFCLSPESLGGGGGGMVVDVGSHMPLEALAGLKCSLGYIVNSCSYFFSSEQNVDLSTMRAICL